MALREKLNGLDDNLTARQMLEQLRDVLDVEDASGGRAEKMGRGYVMAFRVLLAQLREPAKNAYAEIGKVKWGVRRRHAFQKHSKPIFAKFAVVREGRW